MLPNNLRIRCIFAILDITGKVRHVLADHFKDRPRMGKCPKEMRIPVIVKGYIEGTHSRDDGTSIEFAMTVEKVEIVRK